jgi:hypothetical protein
MKKLLLLFIIINNECSCQEQKYSSEDSIISLLSDTSLFSENYCERIVIESLKILFQKEYSSSLKNQIETSLSFLRKKTINMDDPSHSSSYCGTSISFLQAITISSNYYNLNSFDRSKKVLKDLNTDSVFLTAPYYTILFESINQISDEQKKSFFIELTQSDRFGRIIEYLIFNIQSQSKRENFIHYALDNTRALMKDPYFHILRTLINQLNLTELNEGNNNAYKIILQNEFQFLESNKDNIPTKWNKELIRISEIISRPNEENK